MTVLSHNAHARVTTSGITAGVRKSNSSRCVSTMKAKRPPAPAPMSPPVRQSGEETSNRNSEMLRKEKMRRGARSTILSDYSAPSGKPRILG